MEPMKYNVTQSNSPNIIFLILSILSWLLLAINNLASLKWLCLEYNSIWNIFTSFSEDDLGNFIPKDDDSLNNVLGPFKLRNLQNKEGNFLPLQINGETIYKIFNFFFIIAIIWCATLIFKTFIKKDQAIIDGMFGKYSKFHFVPLLFGFAMSLLGEVNDFTNADDINICLYFY